MPLDEHSSYMLVFFPFSISSICSFNNTILVHFQLNLVGSLYLVPFYTDFFFNENPLQFVIQLQLQVVYVIDSDTFTVCCIHEHIMELMCLFAFVHFYFLFFSILLLLKFSSWFVCYIDVILAVIFQVLFILLSNTSDQSNYIFH